MGSEKLGVEFGSTNGAEWVVREPGVGAMDMEAVVATGDHSGRLLSLDLVQADGAFGAQDQFFTGDSGKLLQLQSRQTLVSDLLHRHPVTEGLVSGGGVPKKAHVDDENRAHAEARQEKREKNRIKHFAFSGFGLSSHSLEPLSDSKREFN
ncbi:hypothetical protein ACSQ67_026075 [Phaseolus vulgaris]